MVGILTSMKFAMLGHSSQGMRLIGWLLGIVALIMTWGPASPRPTRPGRVC
ncbi:hypothetical protein ACQBAU_12900 [Propionibacteriaceae bacterium Y2011]